jgi:hypothetical protein
LRHLADLGSEFKPMAEVAGSTRKSAVNTLLLRLNQQDLG